jgi:hypothetical protein
MPRAATLLVLSLALAASGARADAPVVQKAFGNTIVSTYPDGRKGELWLQASGAYSAEGRKHDPSSGHWSVKGDKLCLKQSRPIPMPVSFCTPLPSGGMGQSWKAKAVSGEQISVKLVKGHAKG